YDEVQEEYAVDENGDSVLVKKKIVKKYQPPDSIALKTYLELGLEKSYEDMSDEELQAEKSRLLALLKEQDDKSKSKKKKTEKPVGKITPIEELLETSKQITDDESEI
ncbi:MAG: hypothetical protein J5713_04275, partial [Clostridia bacterium]|nr:hypothetical protein [Clostridia bacterium]